jgi:hypothetical protein
LVLVLQVKEIVVAVDILRAYLMVGVAVAVLVPQELQEIVLKLVMVALVYLLLCRELPCTMRVAEVPEQKLAPVLVAQAVAVREILLTIVDFLGL